MTCKEVQEQIRKYIQNELTDTELAAFVKHVETCPECYEELEVYYTMHRGLQQLDSDNENFDMYHLLQDALQVSKQQIARRRGWGIYYGISQVVAICGLIGIIIMEIIKL